MGSHDIIIGIDGGGTGCRLRATASGRSVTLTGGPANVSNFTPALEVLNGLIAQALADLALPAETPTRLHAGLAGVISPDQAQAVRDALPDFHRVTVTDDRPTTIAGALGSEDGAVVALGTGSFVGRQSGGQIRGLGGCGWKIGDQASGAWAGKRLMEETALAAEALRAPTPLTDALLQEMGGLPGLIAHGVAAQPTDFAALAPRLATSDDPVAQQIMTEGASYVVRALTVLGHRAGEPLCLTGGFGPALEPFLPDALRAGLCAPKGSALDGACALATRAKEATP